MCPKFRNLIVLFLLLIGILVNTSHSKASEPIATVTTYKGDVLIQSDTEVYKLTKIGQGLNEGDRIQTGEGELQITFIDGALIKIRPHTSVVIQEREEKRGFWIFKTKEVVRRITCFVGKLWFKSGLSKRKNYLQTPTAVIGIRGSDADFGFDLVDTFLNMYTGEAEIFGKVVRGFFDDPGISAAGKSSVYAALNRAYSVADQAKKTTKPLDLAIAKAESLRVVKEAAVELQENPDEYVRKEAVVAEVVADARIAAAEAAVAVEKINEAKETAENVKEAAENARQAAETEGDKDAAEKAEEAAEKADAAQKSAEEAVEKAEQKAKESEDSAEQAIEAAKDMDLENAKVAAEKAKEASEGAKEIERETVALIKAVTIDVEKTISAPVEEIIKESAVETLEEPAEETVEETTADITGETTEETTVETTAETTSDTTTEETTSSSSTSSTSTTTSTTSTEEATASPAQ